MRGAILILMGIIVFMAYIVVTAPEFRRAPVEVLKPDTVYVVADSICVPPDIRKKECESILRFLARRQGDSIVTWFTLDCESVY